MKQTNNWLNRILSILLICVMISQTCFSVYGANQDAATEHEATDTQSETTAESVSETDAASKLTLNANETQSLTLTTDMEYSGIELGEGSILSVNTQGHILTVTGDITGKGKLTLTGKNIKVQNISVSDLVFDGATVDASETDSSKENTHEITAAESLTVQNSEISNAAFLGYDETVTGNRTLTFGGTGNTLSDIALVGTYQNANVNVWVAGVSLISNATNINFCYDNKITYKDQENELTAASDWPVSYRTTYSGNTADATVTGYHTYGNGETPGAFAAVADGNVPLPEYTKDGYVYQGWMMGESTEIITSLAQKLSGDITLQVSMAAAGLTVTTDLGYEPSAETNDDYTELKKEESRTAAWGETLALATPSRFGYTFVGWKVIKEDGDIENQTGYTDSYTTSLQDATLTENGNYVIRLEAQWTAKSFPFRFFVKDADVNSLQVKIGDQTYDSVQTFADAYTNIIWNSLTSQLELPEFQYGETLSSYLNRIDLSEMPTLVDTRDAANRKDFEGWTTPGGKLMTDDLAFVLGGILDNKAGSVTLAAYESSIHSTPLFLTSIWQDAGYTLTVGHANGWEILINDNVQTLDENGNAEFSVQVGSSITFRTSAGNPENFSLWNFSDDFLPVETTYSSGANYISYTTVMPYRDVKAVYSDSTDMYIDIAKSSIAFVENVSLPSGRTVDGFWYDQKMEATAFDNMNVNGMTPAFQAGENDAEHAGKYFYIWDFKDTFQVTSCNVATQNQLTLVNAMTVALKNCKLAATDAYKNDAQGRKLKDVLLEGVYAESLKTTLANLDLRQYGNIILDVETHQKYTTKIETEGENAVGVIVQSHFDGNTAYDGTLEISGTTGKITDKLTVSGTLLNEELNFNSLTLLQDETVSSDYLIYCTAINEGIGNINFSGCDVEAEKKRIHTYRGNFTFKQGNGNVNSSMKIGGVRTYGASNVYGNTYIRCFGDWLGAFNTLSLFENSSAVIDGNLLATYSHWTAGAKINTNGYLIVKGNRADLENLELTRGTVIANAAVIGRSCAITGGTLIANQIMNSPAKYPVADADGNYMYIDSGSCVALTENDDNYPFVTYAQNNAKKGEFWFGGTSKIYLLGYYKTSGDRVYDTTVNATDSENPVAGVIAKVIAADGNLNASASLSDEELQNMVKNSSYMQNECVLLGNSMFHTAARMRSVLVSGAQIYAAGNLTFFNDTEITSGSVYCNGRLSGKRDLSIGGDARVNALEVGNNYNLTTADESDITRWQKTAITGGTIITDRLGTASSSYGQENNTVSSGSTLMISGNPVIQAKTEGETITYATDIYLNYLADKDTFTLPENLPNSVHYEGSAYQDLRMAQAVPLSAPTLKADNSTAAWVLDSLAGKSVDTINEDATFSFENQSVADENAYKERDKICFYAVKGTYDLSVAEGTEQISQITVGGTYYTNFDSAIPASRGTEVTVTLNDTSMAGKSVIWYQDAAGQIYNVNPTETTDNTQTTLTFTMPAASVQIYVTNEMKLYLNRYEISITKDGFRTQYDAETDGEEEHSFTYTGNLVITQDNLTRTEFDEKGTIGVNGVSEGETTADPGTLTKEATTNRLHIESDNANRSVTLNKIIMDGGQDEDKIIVEENCGDVELQVDGAVRVLSTYLKNGSNLIWTGKNKKVAGTAGQDIIQFDSGTASTANITGFIHNGEKDQTGNVTFDHLNIIRSNKYGATSGSTRRTLVYSLSQKESAVVTFKDCNMEATVESSMTLVSNYPKVVVEDSTFDITVASAWNSPFFNNCSDVTIKGGSFSYLCGASYGAFPLYYGANNFCIDGAKVDLSNRNSGDNLAYRMVQPDNMIPDEFTVKNAGELNVDHRIKLKKLTLTSDGAETPKVNVGKTLNNTYDGSLLCKDITVEKGEIHTGRLLISGYYSAPYTAYDYQAKTDILAQLREETYLAENGMLTVKDGTVEATEEIGGALGGTITVDGGQITSPAIGSCNKLYGYGQYLPTAAENEWIYSISRVPERFTININGGAINVPSDGYLGGMKTSVNITGGNVNLQGNAILGMTETQKTQLTDYYSSRGDNIAKHTDTNCLITVSGGSVEKDNNTLTASGSICAPYGSVKISGKDTRIKVSNMQAEYGNIEIRESQGGYKNPYTGGENGQYKKDQIGIWITDTLSAQNVNISDNAQVYAANAYAEISNGTGLLTVKEAALYSNAYGEKGVSRKEEDKQYNDTSNTTDQTVFGTRLVSVTYDQNPQDVISEADLPTVENDNPTGYVVGSSEGTISLKDASCKGYRFLGWYTSADYSGNKVEALNTAIANNLTLYAKWERIKVKFQVMMDENSTGNYYNDAEFTGNSNWTSSDSSYISSKTVELSYGDRILTTNGVNLMDYTTNTLGITELEIQEADYSGSTIINAGTIVSKDLAEFYKKKVSEDSNAVLILHVKNVQKRIATVRFNVNKKAGKPVDAAFSNGTAQISANVGVDKKISEVSDFADSSVTEGKSTGLIKPAATGYTFIGWNTEASATKDTENGWVTADTIFKTDTTVYAIWQANTYLVAFDAGEGSWVTSKNEAPQTSDSEVKTLSYYWVYDTPVSTDQSFRAEGTDQYMTEMPYAWREGYVFDHNNGWTYSYTDENTGKTVTEVVTSTAELSKQVEKTLDTSKGDPNGNPTQTALTLTASYTPVTVTYHLNDGTWTDKNAENKVTPEYGMALAGYVKEENASQNDEADSFRKLAGTTGENGSQYYVADTAAAYFSEHNKEYVVGDYRNSLTRKGYTFYGWYQTQDKANAAITDNTNASTSVGTTPRFNNVDLYAAWKPNSYTLQIKNKDADKNYAYTTFGVPGNTSGSNEAVATEISVTTGQEIASENWPSRDFDKAWYVQDKNDSAGTTKRYFLGATFAALDPGAKTGDDAGKTIYDQYVKALSELEKVDGLYQNTVNGGLKGTVFQLPDDTNYRKAIAGTDGADTYTVPDYPSGSDITMYAVYREQSIVFVERYVDKEGKLRETIKETADCNTWSNYPTNYSNPDLNYGGYTLVGWYVNTTEANENSRYPDNAKDYQINLQSYTQEAVKNGTYDIMVYTVYAPEINNSVQLNAQSDPTSTSYPSSTYTLPGSMQKGVLSMALSQMSGGLQLISTSKMQEHEYDSSWEEDGKTYTSDTAVAIQITVVYGQGSSVTKDLSELSDGTLGFGNLEIGAGDQITLTLHHSRVMTKKNSYSFLLNAGFTKTGSDGTNTLENQKINNTVTVNLTPSMYTVNYSMELPETPDKLTVLEANGQEDWGDFSRPENNTTVITKQVKTAYGSALLMNFPKLEGYTAKNGWWITDDTTASSILSMYQNLTVKVSDENKGVINLTSGYTAQANQLSVSAEVLKHWKVTYSDGVNDTTEKELSVNAGEDSATVTVNYHSVIKFTPTDPSNVDPAEFVTLTLGAVLDSSTTKLPDYATVDNDGTYTFTMPAQDVTGSYVTVETLYLEDGTISITDNGYIHKKAAGDVEKTWRGDYRILQNAQNDASKETANTLILAEDLSGRTISLGNLNISSANSIELKAQNGECSAAKVTLTMDAGSTITAKNIQVPADCELTLSGMVSESADTISNTLILSPNKTNAGVGGTADEAANGKITLSNLQINLTMPDGSTASGIGPVSRDTEGAKLIALANCDISVEEQSTTEVYQGVWIGGNNVPEVTMNNVKLNNDGQNHMAGPAITAGTTVNITDSRIGTTDKYVNDPVYAAETLNIKNSKIYMNIQDDISKQVVSVPIGTVNQNGITTVQNSVIKVIKTGSGVVSDIYSGTMKIADADSNVLIDGTQLVEITNGSVTLNGNTYTQAAENHEADTSRKNYRLLEEGTEPSTVPDLTVEALPENGHVEIQQPLSDGRTSVGVGKLTIQKNTEFVLNGNLDVNGTAVIKMQEAAPITVKVTADSNYGISFKDSGTAVFEKANGSTYVQKGGSLSSASDFSDASLNVRLNNVTATVPNLYADELIIDGSSVTGTATESKVGSKPAENGVSVVTIKNASVTADTIGALGTYDKTFTTVTTENATLNGKLVQDHYRLNYDIGRATLDTTSLPKTVRTETQMPADSDSDPSVLVLPKNGIPGNPTGTDSNLFGSWYINDKTGTRKALLDENATLPAGLKERTTLNGSTPDDVKSNDKTTDTNAIDTLTVHAWMKVTGTVTMEKGRLFQNFTDRTAAVSVQSNGAWTAQLVSTGTSIENRDYQVTFGGALPVGTTLTLTEPATASSAGKYYWYKVSSEKVSSVKFTEFTTMGGTDKFHSVTETENIPENETFLLSVDFSEASAEAVNDQSVTFRLLPSEETTEDAVTIGEAVTYSLTDVSKGTISISGQGVTVKSLPNDADQLTGQKLFLKAVINKKDSSETGATIPYYVTAKWKETSGTWISRDTVLFEMGEYDSMKQKVSGGYTFTGLENGTYQISWSIVYGKEAFGNIAGNVVSNTETTDYPENHTEPSLKVTTDTTSRVISARTGTSLTFNCITDSENVTVAVEKQGELCEFTEDKSGMITVQPVVNGQMEVVFGKNVEGTYRIRFSINDKTTEDDVYFVFIVE